MKMSNSTTTNLSNELYSELTVDEKEKFNGYCIHVTDLLKSEYDENAEQSALIRGKLYHFAIESLLRRLEEKGKLKILEMENSRKLMYNVRNKDFPLCFTPDAIVQLDGKTILLEIKSTIKSRDYAILQTSIYKYLLETHYGYKIDQCLLITGDLQTYKLMCNSDVGKQTLDERLGNSLLLFM
jgi:hypothetical protein